MHLTEEHFIKIVRLTRLTKLTVSIYNSNICDLNSLMTSSLLNFENIKPPFLGNYEKTGFCELNGCKNGELLDQYERLSFVSNKI